MLTVENALRAVAIESGSDAIIGVKYTDTPIVNSTDIIGYSVTMYGTWPNLTSCRPL